MSKKVGRLKERVLGKVGREADKFQADFFEREYKQKIQFFASLKGAGKGRVEEAREKEEDGVDADAHLEKYYNDAVKTISVCYMPVIVYFIWLFYEETAFASKWSIKKKDFIFYFLFSLIIIPFQIVIDILFYNIMTYCHKFDYLGSIAVWSESSPRLTQSSARRARPTTGGRTAASTARSSPRCGPWTSCVSPRSSTSWPTWASPPTSSSSWAS